MTHSEELAEYIKSMIKSVKKGIEDTGFDVVDPIVLDLAVVNSRRPEGGFDIFVVKGEHRYDDSQLSRLRVSIRKHREQPIG